MPPYPYDHQFRKLMALSQTGEGEELFAELLRSGPMIRDPLLEFLTQNSTDPQLAVLIELLVKSQGHASRTTVISFIASPIARLRRAACNAAGWIRCREALHMLDRLEAEDPDPAVRAEARAAIDEILKDWPGLVGNLQHHEIASSTRTSERLPLVLPRLLAQRYNVAPLGLTSAGVLRIAVRNGNERRQLAPLEALTGREVVLEGTSDDVIRSAIEKTYHHGDDDFIQSALEIARVATERLRHGEPGFPYFLAENLFGSLTPTAIEELTEEILLGIRPSEPCCPLEEASDAIEGFQSFVAQMHQRHYTEARLSIVGENIALTLRRGPESSESRELELPGMVERLFALINFLLTDAAGDIAGSVRSARLKVGPSDAPMTLELRLGAGGPEGPLATLRLGE